ncbi:MAG: hypothetical protein LH629_00500 [Ignavibacteria bacterium]|nr:hypothetical protein [Ignavibacteria bacterium]
MGKIYNTEGIAATPAIDFNNINEWQKQEKVYTEKVKQYAKKNGKGEYAGEEVSFPHADGEACYVVLSLSPVELFHLEIGDSWDLPYIDRLKATDIKSRIKTQKAINKLFKN